MKMVPKRTRVRLQYQCCLVPSSTLLLSSLHIHFFM
ncbi:hypothetical protein NC651_017307 [Populus alba x Populus x berolinensis]|nr:hypothetical protein NC651_017307 [Populus alba x Populus x berolinensis]